MIEFNPIPPGGADVDDAMKPPRLIANQQGEYLNHARRWQGIPTIERAPDGRIFFAFYSGGEDEGIGNFVVLFRTDDEGATMREPFLAVAPSNPDTCRVDLLICGVIRFCKISFPVFLQAAVFHGWHRVNFLEFADEIGGRMKPAFVGDLFHREIGVKQQLNGKAEPEIPEICGAGFSGLFDEQVAEIVRSQVIFLGKLFEGKILPEAVLNGLKHFLNVRVGIFRGLSVELTFPNECNKQVCKNGFHNRE